jgi:Xaa-Pro aminopeptidase
MFQSFDVAAEPSLGPPRVQRLRKLMREEGLDAVLVPRADEHQGEYVPPSAERLKWLTGFTGSAGFAAIGARSAAIFIDGRYTEQVRLQVDPATFEPLQVPEASLSDWLVRAMPKGGVVGFDPWLHTESAIEGLGKALAGKGITLKPLLRNPVDAVWGRERPAPPRGPVALHPLRFAGKTAGEKIAELQQALRDARQGAVVLTLPDSIAWLLNIRGSDVAHNPVPLAFAVVPDTGKPTLFIDPAKLGEEALAHLQPLVTLARPRQLMAAVAALKRAGVKVRLDPDTAATALFRKLRPAAKHVARGTDPCLLPKARKNPTEIAGARLAHKRDGAAMARFLAWLDREAPKGRLDEIKVAERLEEFRAETQALKEISFDTISGAGPNGAIVHYRVGRASNRRLGKGELYLVDSGAQYAEGTTDVTRTVAIGRPSPEMKERFSLVLEGMIAVATARFPKGTRGSELDPFARRALWQRGLDFDHGTGHGVGSYLSVHEGPQSISRRGAVALEPGMICSDEPGYYKAGHYGIRIENLLLVGALEAVPGGDRPMMAFETLTLVPIDRRLVDATVLSPAALAWLDAYHARVREEIGPELGPEDRAWLEAATAPIG